MNATTYTVLGTANHYSRFSNYDDAYACAKQNEKDGRKVAIVQTKKGADWTVYKSLDCTPEY